MTTTVPPGLDSRGRAYWEATTAAFDLTDSELQMLIEACRIMDRLDLLDTAIRADGPMVTGSAGQPVVHPGLTEARGQQAVLHRLLAALQLPDEDGEVIPATATLRARKAAATRWQGQTKKQAR